MLPIISNAGSARSTGIEVDLVANNLVEGLTLQGGFTVLDAVLDEDTDQALAGARLPLVPRASFNLLTHYTFPITAAFDGFAGLDFRYTGREFSSIENRPSPDNNNPFLSSTRAFTQLDLHAGIKSRGISFHIFANNVFNEGLMFDDSMPDEFFIDRRGREIGIVMQLDFDGT